MKNLFLRLSLLCMMSLFALGVSASPDKDYLCFTANETGSTVKLVKKIGVQVLVTLETSSTGEEGSWSDYTIGNIITLTNKGDKVYFRNKTDGVTGLSTSTSDYYQFVMTGSIAASGNIMSLVDKSCTTTTIPCNHCFFGLFAACASLTTAPKLSATTLAASCYRMLFYACTNLNSVKVAFTDWAPSGVTDATYNWLQGVPSNGTFVCPSGLNVTTRSTTYVPTGWTVINPSITALTVPSSVYVNNTATFSTTTENMDNPTITYYVKKDGDEGYGNALESNTFTPTEAGTYTVKSVAFDCITVEKEETFTVLAHPEITSISVIPESGYVGGTFTFAATPNYFVGKPTKTYYVKKSTDEEYPETALESDTFVPTEAGTYDVKVVAECADEPTAEAEETFTVKALPEITELTVNPESDYAGKTFTFSATYGNFEGTPTISYYVKKSTDEEYGDALEGNTFVPTEAGTYKVKAVAESADEPTAEAEETFTVLATEIELTVENLGWASLYYDKALTIPANVKVYYASEIQGDDVTLVPLFGKIPAETGVIVKANQGTIKFQIIEEDVPALEGTNLFKGLTAATPYATVAESEGGKTIYVLAGKDTDGVTLLFQPFNTTLDLAANKVYLPLASQQSNIKLHVADEDATDIGAVRSKENGSKAVNLMGIPVYDNYKGIILKGGKKFIRH